MPLLPLDADSTHAAGDCIPSRPAVEALLESTAERLLSISATNIRVHCITNAVALELTANTLLSVGAIPSLTTDPEEVGEFVSSASALLINLGMHDATRQLAIDCAIESAQRHGIPWILDPVFAERSEPRKSRANRALSKRPTVMRANERETTALRDRLPLKANGKRSPDQGARATASAAANFGADPELVLAQTGAQDRVIWQGGQITIQNGHELMSKVTATGCALSALVAAFVAARPPAWEATAGALLCWSIAGELAAEQAGGPGSLPGYLLDNLYQLNHDKLIARARVSIDTRARPFSE